MNDEKKEASIQEMSLKIVSKSVHLLDDMPNNEFLKNAPIVLEMCIKYMNTF